MAITLKYKNGLFLASFTEPNLTPSVVLKKDGWKYNKQDGWFTTNLKSASLLREFADDSTKILIDRAFIQYSPWEGALSLPKGLKLLPHQPGAVRYAMSRNKSYLALAPGLGKTPIAALIARFSYAHTLIVVPPFLTLNTLEEFNKWAPNVTTKIISDCDYIKPDVLIVPDSQICNPDVREYIRFFKPEILIVDEFHRYKTEGAKRSKAMFGHTFRGTYHPGITDGRNIKKVVLLSGTPVPNGRPIELYPTLRKFAGEYIDFMNMHHFGLKYCNAFEVKNEYTGHQYGYDYNGCNEREYEKLMNKVKSKDDKDPKGFMLRLDKSILGLPKLTEEIVVVSEDMPRELKSMNKEILKRYSPEDLIKMSFARSMGLSTDEEIHLMSYRRLLGVHKVKPASEFIKSILDDTNENILVVAIHKEVVAALEERLSKFNPVVITGSTPVNKRQQIVKDFQASKSKRIIIGNVDAIGVGFNITKVNRVVLVEFDWSDGKNRQVIDRAHRYGLKHEVVAQYLCFRNSLDRRTIETLLRKQHLNQYV